MTLRNKTPLVLAAALLGFIAILLLTTRFVILNEYSKLENQETNTNLKRLLNAYNEDMAAFDSFTEDDSRWDEAYSFVLGNNPNFPENNFTAESAASLRLNLIMIFDNSGKLLFGTLFDAQQNKQPIPGDYLEKITSFPELIHMTSLTSGLSGNLFTPQGPVMISSHPIRTSQGEGPVVGVLIFGRNLDSAEIQRLAGGALLTTSFADWANPQLPHDFEVAKTYLSGSGSGQNQSPSFILPVNNNTIAGYTVLKDVRQNETLLLRIDLPRTIYNQGQGTVRSLSIYILIIGLAFVGILILLINMYLITPITQLKDEARGLGLRGEFTTRLPVEGKDEIANLRGSFNSLLEALDLRTRELKAASEIQRRLNQYQSAVELCHKIGKILNQKELLEKTIELTQEQFKLTFAGVYLIHEDSGSLKLAAATGETGKKLITAGYKVSITSLLPIIRPLTSRKISYEPEANAATLGPMYAYLPSTRSTLDLPLISGHQVMGILSLYSNVPNNFDEGDIRVLEGIAQSLSISLENVRLYHEVEDNLEKLQTLHRQYLGEAWAKTSKAAGGLNYTYENEQPFELAGQPQVLDVPIELREQVIGRLMLEVDRTSLSPEEINMVETIATETAVALENTRLLEETQRRAEREQFLADLSNKVRATSDVDSIMRTAIFELGRALKASEGLIRLETSEDNR
jgi:sensor domain CHASE-containing protein/GAF domain-containing protein